MAKVSIIVAVYNVEQYLRRCLNSLLNQTYDDYEIICVNDCSPDNSQYILDKYAKQFPDKLKVLINEENKGLGRSRMRGLATAQGEYVMFVDSDDYVRKDYVQTYIDAMQSGEYDMIVAGFVRDMNGHKKKHLVSDSIWSIITYPIACAKLYRKSFLVDNHIQFSEVRCGEDIYFSLAITYSKPRFKVIPYAGYYYYFNCESITGSMNYTKNHEEFVANIYGEFLDNYDLSVLDEETKRVIEYSYISNMVNAMITYNRGAKPKLMRKKYTFVMRDMKNKFPDYKKNPYVGLCKPKGQTLKIKLGVGVPMLLNKVGLDKYLYDVISLL